MSLYSRLWQREAVFYSAVTLLLCIGVIVAPGSSIVNMPSVDGLCAQIVRTNIMLTWPSDPRETFVILWRSNDTIQTPWIVLTNQLPASSVTHKTSFCDVGGLSRSSAMGTNASLKFYRVFVIPDFWFDMNRITLSGGPKNSGEDFLPFYYGTKETDIFQPWVELFVDGKDQNTGSGQGFGTDIERINFGTAQNPRWIYVSGLWFRHDLLTNGMHSLQLRSQFTLNNFIGAWSQNLMVSNKPEQVRTSNDLTFSGWNGFLGKTNYEIVAHSVERQVKWQIKIYSGTGQFLVQKVGHTTNGDIQWTWNLRDQSGHLHGHSDQDRVFFPSIKVWPIGSERRSEKALNNDTWWDQRLGCKFVRKYSPFMKNQRQAPSGHAYPSVQHVPSRPLDLPWLHTDPPHPAMVLQLRAPNNFIRVTPEYSNAVLAALLPYYSKFAKRLDLPVPHPITVQDVAHCGILPWQNKDGGVAGGGIILKNGWSFGFQFGYVNSFESPHSYFGLQDPREIPKYYGQVKMTTNEAVKLARDTIKKLGIPLRDVFANQEPKITPPERIGTNIVPYFLVEWISPHGGSSARVEINAEAKRAESLLLNADENLMRPWPKVNVIPTSGHGMFDSQIPPPMNPAYALKLLPIMFHAIDRYAQTLSLPVTRPLTTNNVAKVEAYNNGGWPHCEVTLTNGWRFIYRHCMVNGYYAPETFFDNRNRPYHLKEFEGRWNLTTNQAIELVKTTLARLNYPTNDIHMDFAPTIIFASGNFKKIIPRYFLEWYYAPHNELQSKVEAEVNADNGKLESLYYDDKAYWNCRPPIDVPISIKHFRGK